MKTLQWIAFTIVCVYISSCDTNKTVHFEQTEEESITAVENVVQKLFDEVWAGYDANAITKFQTDDFLLLEHGEVWNNDTIANWCKKAKSKNSGFKRTNNFERIDARRNGNKLWLAYHNYGTFQKDTITYKRAWLESVIAVKKDSIWKLELMHSTRQPVQ